MHQKETWVDLEKGYVLPSKGTTSLSPVFSPVATEGYSHTLSRTQVITIPVQTNFPPANNYTKLWDQAIVTSLLSIDLLIKQFQHLPHLPNIQDHLGVQYTVLRYRTLHIHASEVLPLFNVCQIANTAGIMHFSLKT